MKILAKFTSVLISFLFVINISLSQTDSIYHNQIIEKHITRNVIWFTPSNANTINGLALGGTPYVLSPKNDSLRIRGLNIEINPVAFGFSLIYVPLGILFSPFSNAEDAGVIGNRNIYYDSLDKSNITICGFNFGILGTYNRGCIKGLNLSLLSSFGYKMNGFSTTIGLNLFYSYNGFIIGIQNKTTKGKGLQIGLFNYCNECKGIQIGLWNKMGNRTLPFINMRF